MFYCRVRASRRTNERGVRSRSGQLNNGDVVLYIVCFVYLTNELTARRFCGLESFYHGVCHGSCHAIHVYTCTYTVLEVEKSINMALRRKQVVLPLILYYTVHQKFSTTVQHRDRRFRNLLSSQFSVQTVPFYGVYSCTKTLRLFLFLFFKSSIHFLYISLNWILLPVTLVHLRYTEHNVCRMYDNIRLG